MLETSIFWCKMYMNCGFDSSLFKHGVNFLLASLENMSLVGHNVANTLDTMSRMTIMFVLFIPKGFLLNISIKSPSVNFPCCIMPFWRHIRHIYILYIYIYPFSFLSTILWTLCRVVYQFVTHHWWSTHEIPYVFVRLNRNVLLTITDGDCIIFYLEKL